MFSVMLRVSTVDSDMSDWWVNTYTTSYGKELNVGEQRIGIEIR